VVVQVIGAAALALACGSSESGAAPPPPVDCSKGCWEPTAADEAFISDVCTVVEACCVTNAYRDAASSDVEGCKKLYRSAGLRRDAALRSACLAELKTLASQGNDCLPEAWDLSDACVRLTFEPSGPQAPGKPCVNRADCEGAPGALTICSGVTSDFSPTYGLCTRLHRGKADSSEPCLGSVTPDGLVAAGPSYPVGMNAPLTTGSVCEERIGIQCGPGNNPASWTCQRLSTAGAACDYSITCASGQCLTSEGVDVDLSSDPGTCTQQVPAGQPCDSTPPAVCDASSFCHDAMNADGLPGGVCETKVPAGNACLNNAMCVSGTCDSNKKLCSTQTQSEALSLLAFCARF
jgi:hypothetical protein